MEQGDWVQPHRSSLHLLPKSKTSLNNPSDSKPNYSHSLSKWLEMMDFIVTSVIKSKNHQCFFKKCPIMPPPHTHIHIHTTETNQSTLICIPQVPVLVPTFKWCSEKGALMQQSGVPKRFPFSQSVVHRAG